LLVSLAGVAVLVVDGSPAPPGLAALGNLLPLVSAASFAVYAILGRRVFAGGNALAIVAGSTQYGLLFLLPGALVEATRGELGSAATWDLAPLLFLGAGCSALAFVLAGYGLAHLEASHGAVLGNVKPLVGVVLAVVVLGEPLTGGQLGGGCFVLVGIGFASRLRVPPPRATDPVASRPAAAGESTEGRRRDAGLTAWPAVFPRRPDRSDEPTGNQSRQLDVDTRIRSYGTHSGGTTMELSAIWRRRPRPKTVSRLALVATELSDGAAAKLGRGTRLAEAEQMRGLLRAGGAVVAHR
jgi:hypothetical protein